MLIDHTKQPKRLSSVEDEHELKASKASHRVVMINVKKITGCKDLKKPMGCKDRLITIATHTVIELKASKARLRVLKTSEEP